MDSFKGFYSSQEAADIVQKEILKLLPDSEITVLNLGDGGEGTIDSLVKVNKGSYEYVDTVDPLNRTIQSRVGIANNKGYIEIADASGLRYTEGKDVAQTSTYGTGILIDYLYKKGIRNIVLALGGSATNDAGMGILEALGADIAFSDDSKHVISSNLDKIKDVDLSAIYDKYTGLNINILSDVKNTILGSEGATYVYGPQKGILKCELDRYEKGMENIVQILNSKLKHNLCELVGGGAAGGTGATMCAVFNSKIYSGIEYVLEEVKFDQYIENADYVITGEGCIDSQSIYGKLIFGVAKHCSKKHIPCIAIGGIIKPGYQELYEKGVLTVASTVTHIMDKETLYNNRFRNLQLTIERIIRLLRFELESC